MLQVVLTALVIVWTTAAAAQGIACRASQQPMLVADLLFGRNIGNRLGVSERQWVRFVASEITPRFPDGLSVVNASGQWRDRRTKRIVREPSKLVTLIAPDNIETQEKIDAIVASYKRTFRQQSVGVIVRPGCVMF
jgi:hypothetical protein